VLDRGRLHASSVADSEGTYRPCVYTDVPIILPDGDCIVLDQYLGKGLQPGETQLPEDAPGE